MRRAFWFLRALKFVVIVAVVLAAMSYIAMTLWNWLVPALFAGPLVNFWQALGLLVLSRLLLGGLRPRGPFGHGHFGHGPFRGGPGRHGRFGRHMHRMHWSSMTPEERERMREHLREFRRHKRGFGPPPQDPETQV